MREGGREGGRGCTDLAWESFSCYRSPTPPSLPPSLSQAGEGGAQAAPATTALLLPPRGSALPTAPAAHGGSWKLLQSLHLHRPHGCPPLPSLPPSPRPYPPPSHLLALALLACLSL